jgi:hypothetical protein
MFGFGKPSKPVPPPAAPRETSRWVVRSTKDCQRGTHTSAYRSENAAIRESLRLDRVSGDRGGNEMHQAERWSW